MSKRKTPKPGSQQQVVKRPPCVLFSVKEANEADLAAMKKLREAGYDLVVVQEQHFERALKASEQVRRRPPTARADWVWSGKLPTRTGWYWFHSFRRGKTWEPQKCVFVEMHPTMGPLLRDGRMPFDAKAWPGEWCGPIPEPLTPATG